MRYEVNDKNSKEKKAKVEYKGTAYFVRGSLRRNHLRRGGSAGLPTFHFVPLFHHGFCARGDGEEHEGARGGRDE